MYSIVKLKEDELKNAVKTFSNAYPGVPVSLEQYEERILAINKYSFVNFYGVYDEDNLIGGMRLHDFNMNLLQQKITAGGVGSVAVDLLRKKEKVAKEMIKFFLYHFREKGASMALLYPFNPEFYKKMGFGFGTSMNQFKICPKNLPKGYSKKNIKLLTVDDAEAMCIFYNKMVDKTNGLIEKCTNEFKGLFRDPSNKVFGYKVNGEILGYMVLQFRKGDVESFLINDIFISEILFHNSEVFLELMTFLNSQSDQFRYIIINTQDENFRFALKDPRNNSSRLLISVYHECSAQGTGIMYRVINVKKLFQDLKEHNFNNISCKLKLKINDTFMEENNDSYIIQFIDGKATCVDEGEYDVELSIDIADFSSLITCVVDLKSLYRYGLVKLSKDEYLNKLNTIFASDEKPRCLTSF
ncbi:GNAT family N-acetyltransferase [Clostridium malenominatum]|uniref:GNAT family N-acetyltransferase n=1 Tax=Clostridium malenominatum TaxID=1539 RepID=A0ABN1J0Q1_9CLOT